MAKECGTIPFSVQVRARSTISQSAPYATNRWLVCRHFLAVCILNKRAPAHVILALVRSSCSACKIEKLG